MQFEIFTYMLQFEINHFRTQVLGTANNIEGEKESSTQGWFSKDEMHTGSQRYEVGSNDIDQAPAFPERQDLHVSCYLMDRTSRQFTQTISLVDWKS